MELNVPSRLRNLRLLALASVLVPLLAPTTSRAQEAEAESEIIVTGQRLRGAVAGDIQPEITLSAADVRALGVSSVTELLAELSPQLSTGQGNGPPIVLLEGRRISSFREIATLPAEAIARVEILPAEVALKFGFPSTQKVANIVLRQRFRAFTVEADARIATDGGVFQPNAAFDYLRIARNGRFNLNVDYVDTGALFESQRSISGAGQEPFRTLIPAQQLLKLSSTLNRIVTGDISATINGEYVVNQTQAFRGSSPFGARPLESDSTTRTANVGATFNGQIAAWRWTATGRLTRVDADQLNDRADTESGAAGFTLARSVKSRSDLVDFDLSFSGTPLRLPAGDVSATIKGGAAFTDFSVAGASDGDLTRNIAEGQFSLDVPLASRRRASLAFMGDLSVNANIAVRRLSDFGTLSTLGYGANWTPLIGFNLLASFRDDDTAPTVQQLGNLVIITPNVPVYDFVRRQTALVRQISGGNDALGSGTARTWKLGVTLKPLSQKDLTLTGEFVRTKTINGIASLPPASRTAQAAFPDRYFRNFEGDLVSIDTRPLNFAQANRSQLRWGINVSVPLKTSQARIDAMRSLFREIRPTSVFGPTDGPPGGGAAPPGGGGSQGAGGWRGGGFGGFGGGGPGGPGGGGRLTLSAYHTVRLTDTVNFRLSSPVIDLLDGGVTGTGGGQSRHELEVQAGLYKNGFGSRITGNWQSATRVAGTVPIDDLRFSSLATVNLRLFANLGQLPSIVKVAPWVRGLRVSLGVNNALNERQRVTDGAGETPSAYQPGYLDPLGRTIRLSIRKQFF
jgi:iron complex outermembrane recepter protein